MKYRVQQYSWKEISYLKLESTDTGEYISILPAHGGTVHQIALCVDGGLPQQILDCDAPEEIPLNPWFRGRILFPFDDRVHGGRYRFAGETYQLPINDPDGQDALHGFLYAQKLELALSEATQEYATAVLEGEVDAKPGYPFCLHIRLQYTLSSKGFLLDVQIKNSGTVAAPYSIGWHPYFRLTEENVNPLKLLIPADRFLETDEKLVPSGRFLPVAGSRLDFRASSAIGSRELDHGYLNPAGYMECSGENTKIRIEQSQLFAYSQVFVPPARSSVALEPISAATDAFNKPDLGLRVLQPGERDHGRILVRLCKL
ncbi:MAG: aldose 1-epimerase [Spirochaetia bacterium]|nr:aldose 1-epimerase [Spirochaetia bacterium]